MIALPARVHVWLARGRTDMRRGVAGLASQVQQHLKHDPLPLMTSRFRRGFTPRR
jgi:transposase